MRKSLFQFTDPQIIKTLFEINENFKEDKYNGIPLQLNVKKNKENEYVYSVRLEVIVGSHDEKCPYYTCAIAQARFKTEVVVPEDKLETLLSQNATSLLLSYIRPVVARCTNDAGFSPFNIPFINLTEDKDNNEFIN